MTSFMNVPNSRNIGFQITVQTFAIDNYIFADIIQPDFLYNILLIIFFSVYLVGGSSKSEGNVFAINPTTGLNGPVCDDGWDLDNVS